MARNKKASSDETARRRIVQDLDTTFLVEAGAGSGKTTKLVERISELLAPGKTEIGRIAAVTFTRKAAAELRERLQQNLEDRASKDPDPVVRQRLRSAVADIAQGFIGTIHSFCARMLRERPVESGLDPDFTELDEAEGVRLLDTCWHDQLMDAHLRNDPTLKRLKDLGVDPADLEELYLRLCQFRDVEPYAPVCPKPDLDDARRRLRRFMTEVGNAMPASEPEARWDPLQANYRRAQWRLDTYGDSRDRDLIEILELFSKCKVTLNRWPDKNTAKVIRDQLLADFEREVVQKVVLAWREHIHSDCVAFAAAAAASAARRRAAESTLDYTDLLIKARDLLRDNEEVRRFFARRFTHVLVDEFQDTDPIQCEILFFLSGDPPKPGAGWREFKLRPGALFVVGDPKQSIYRFRRADIAAYKLVRDLIQAHGGEVLTLSANYRSVNSIGEFVDAAFGEVFPPEATEQQASFVPLATLRRDAAPLSGVRKLTVEGVEKKDEIFTGSAELIVSWVGWALNGGLEVEDGGVLRPAEPGDILILTWLREPLIPIAEALEARQIPFDISGSRNAFSVPEIQELLKLFSSLADPDNPVALVGVLIGPLFGHSYQDLWDYKKAGGSFRFLGAGQVPEPLAAHPVAVSLAKIETWWSLALDRSPAAAIGSIIERTGIVPLAAASPLGATMAGRLLQLVEMARRAELLNRADFASAVDWLNDAVAGDVEPLSILLGKPALVRVMNLHRAKGLEAPIVILAAPYRFDNTSVSHHVDRLGDKDPLLYLQVTHKTSERGTSIVAQPPGWDQKAVVEQEYQAAERGRLAYVAATRARQLLIVTDAPEIGWGVNPWAELLSEPLQELPMEAVDTSIQKRPKVKVKPAACAKDLQGIAESIAALSRETYGQSSVTELAKTGAALPASGSGMGPEYGSVVHRCLEWMATGLEPTRKDIEQIAAEFELSPVPVDKIVSELQRVKQTELWRRAMCAPERHTEVRFSLWVDGTEVGREPGQFLLSGIIDLAFKESDGWHLVDYKTDRIAGDPAPHVNFYTPQLKLYAKAWNQLSGSRAAELLLFFTDLCIPHAIRCPGDEENKIS